MSLCIILKIFDWKTVLLISNQLFADDSLMIDFYSFKQLNSRMLKSLKTVWKSNIKTWNLHRKLRKMVRCHFWIYQSAVKTRYLEQRLIANIHLVAFFINFESFIFDMCKHWCIRKLFDKSFIKKTFISWFLKMVLLSFDDI